MDTKLDTPIEDAIEAEFLKRLPNWRPIWRLLDTVEGRNAMRKAWNSVHGRRVPMEAIAKSPPSA
jgi:hypothetical protein